MLWTRAIWWIGWRAAASLMCGGMLAVAVAYYGAVRNSTMDFGGYGDGSVNMLRERNPWWDVVSVANTGGSGRAIVASVQRVREWPQTWGTSPVPEEIPAALDLNPKTVVLIGWPARCFWGVDFQDSGHTKDGLWDPPEWVQDRWIVRYPFPTNIWWSGLLINAFLLGMPVLALFCTPTVVRRVRQREAGVCPACGYPLAGLRGAQCPECGSVSSATPPEPPHDNPGSAGWGNG